MRATAADPIPVHYAISNNLVSSYLWRQELIGRRVKPAFLMSVPSSTPTIALLAAVQWPQ